MSFSCTEPCATCRGTGQTTFRQPSSGTLTQISCSPCSGTGEVTWEAK